MKLEPSAKLDGKQFLSELEEASKRTKSQAIILTIILTTVVACFSIYAILRPCAFGGGLVSIPLAIFFVAEAWFKHRAANKSLARFREFIGTFPADKITFTIGEAK